MADLSDNCTLVWPQLREPDGRLPANSDAGAWIIGWNPVGLSVVATALLSNISFEKAQAELTRVKKKLEGHTTPRAVPNYRSLQLLGYVRGSGAGAVGSPDTTAAAAVFPAMSPVTQSASGVYSGALDSPDAKTISSVRAMRKSDIWLELQEGPVLGEVWCCGYRVQPCQLHVIRCDPLRHYSVKPTVFSAVSLYGPGGVRQLKAGKEALHIPGAESNLEGVLLPEVMLKESAPRIALVRAGKSGGTAKKSAGTQVQPSSVYMEKSDGSFLQPSATFVFGSSAVGRRSSHHRRHPVASSSNSGSASRRPRVDTSIYDSAGDGTGSESEVTSYSFLNGAVPMGSFSEGNTHGDSLSQFPGYEDGSGGLRSPILAARPGVPPRLDFPTSVDSAEMSALLRMCASGYNVQCVLQGMPPRYAVTPADKSGSSRKSSCLATTLDEMQRQGTATAGHASVHTNPYAHFVFDALIKWNLLILKVITPLQRASWLMEIVEHRLRELVNLLSLLDDRTISCGLHPALPHRTRCTREGRKICYLNYLARVLTDVVFGIVITLLLRTQGPRMYTMAMHLSRYFLYELHMSYMDWFDGSLAGLKVNEDLNQALCFFAKVVIKCWDLCLRSLFFVDHHINSSAGAILRKEGDVAASLAANRDHDAFGSTEYLWIVPSYDLLVPLSFLGASCSFALVADITSLVTFHLRFLYHAMSLPYRFARVLMSSLSSQFRSKKYNPLRKRTDVYEFTVDQMLMGTFIFAIVVFLFPTVAVYYFYFALIRVSVWCVQGSLAAAAYAMLYLPFVSVLVSSLFNGKLTDQFGGGVALSEPIVTMQRAHPSANNAASGGAAHHTSPSTTVELTVEGRKFSPACFASDFVYVMMVLVKPFVPSHVISLIFSGRSTHFASPRTDLIPHLIANCVDPPCTLCVPETAPPSLLASASAAAAMCAVPQPTQP